MAQGGTVNLLCFVRETSATVRQRLDEYGAQPSNDFRARCFAEVWELPHDEHLARRFAGETCALDKRISEALGCVGGAYSAATGHLLWGDIQEGSERRHWTSRLVQESLAKKGRARE